jgi:hypothetical protein
VNKNVTTPEGAAAAGADTPIESHNRRAHTMHTADPALQPAAVPERLDAAARLACSDSQAKPSSLNNAHSASNGLLRLGLTLLP